jgi:hypothetical protein
MTWRAISISLEVTGILDVAGTVYQSDKIWRIDLQDDLESCHPVGLRITLDFEYGLRILRMTPKILSSCHPVGQPDSMTRSYLVTLRVCQSLLGGWHVPRRRSGQGLTLVHFSAQPEPFLT